MTREQHLIDEIFRVRVENNLPWKRLMEIALKHAPEEAKEALRAIHHNDQAVSDLLGRMLTAPVSLSTEIGKEGWPRA